MNRSIVFWLIFINFELISILVLNKVCSVVASNTGFIVGFVFTYGLTLGLLLALISLAMWAIKKGTKWRNQ